MKRIGIITWHFYNNYGSLLQTYALQTYIESLGNNAIILNYRKFDCVLWKRIIKIILGKIEKYVPYSLSQRLGLSFWSFRNKFLKQSKILLNRRMLSKESQKLDAVICGSDQIWAPSAYKPEYMLNFVSDDILKISYASSIGLNDIPENLISEYKHWISRLNYISVRELQGADLLKRKCNISAKVVLDPTFLLTADQWNKIVTEPTLDEKYIFCYFLNKNHNYKEKVFEILENFDLLNFKIIGISDNKSDSDWMHSQINSASPEMFLGYIKNSYLILTDSFHGTAFSLIYNKDFYVFERFSSDDRMNQNSRIYSILGKLGLLDRIVSNSNNINGDLNIDYTSVNMKIMQERAASSYFLKKSLNELG